jgi:hypothetical protein
MIREPEAGHDLHEQRGDPKTLEPCFELADDRGIPRPERAR